MSPSAHVVVSVINVVLALFAIYRVYLISKIAKRDSDERAGCALDRTPTPRRTITDPSSRVRISHPDRYLQTLERAREENGRDQRVARIGH